MKFLQSWFYIVILCGTEWSIVPTSGTTVQPYLSTTEFPVIPPVEEPSSNKSEQLVVRKDATRTGRQQQDCKTVNVAETYLGLQEVGYVKKKEIHTFFVRPQPSFKRLVLRIQLKHVFEFSDSSDTEGAIDLLRSDLEQGESKPWAKVEVEHYEYVTRGFNSHALRVVVGETRLSLVTDYYWIFYNYEGFVIYAEGGAQVLFNCQPEALSEDRSPKPYINGAWLMVGLLTVAATLLTVLFSVWLSKKCRKRAQTKSPPQQNVVSSCETFLVN